MSRKRIKRQSEAWEEEKNKGLHLLQQPTRSEYSVASAMGNSDWSVDNAPLSEFFGRVNYFFSDCALILSTIWPLQKDYLWVVVFEKKGDLLKEMASNKY